MSYKVGDKNYRGYYRDAAGGQHTKMFTRKTDADRWEAEQKAAVRNDAWIDPARAKMTVGQWAEPWMAGRVHLKPKTLASYRSLLTTQVLPTWRKMPMSKIRHSDVVAWVAAIRTELSASRTRQAYHLLTSMLDDAVKDGRLMRNPAAGVDLPRLAKGKRRYLTHRQLSDVAEGCGRHRLMVMVLGYTGLRWGEVVGLRAGHVAPLTGRIDVVEAVTDVNGKMLVGTPKTHQFRAVVVPPFLREELAERVSVLGPDDLVFPGRTGAPLRVQNFRRDHFDRATAAAGVPGLTPHELRHTAASLAIASGADPKVIQSMLGHASATTSMDRYGHLLEDRLDEVAHRIGAARAYSVLTEPPVAPVTSIVRKAE